MDAECDEIASWSQPARRQADRRLGSRQTDGRTAGRQTTWQQANQVFGQTAGRQTAWQQANQVSDQTAFQINKPTAVYAVSFICTVKSLILKFLFSNYLFSCSAGRTYFVKE